MHARDVYPWQFNPRWTLRWLGPIILEKHQGQVTALLVPMILEKLPAQVTVLLGPMILEKHPAQMTVLLGPMILEKQPAQVSVLLGPMILEKHPNGEELSRNMTKLTKWSVYRAKTRISLGIRPVWPESSLCALWVAKDPMTLHADGEDSDQTARMPRLIWIFARRTCHFAGFVVRRLKSVFVLY